MQALLLWKRNKYYTTWVCVFVALGIQHAKLMNCVTCISMTCPAVQRFSTLSHKRNDFREKKVTKTKYVFWFSLQRFSETFLILRRNARDMIKMFIGLRVKYPLFLSAFNETWIFSTDFRKILKYQIRWKSVPWKPSCSTQTDGRTDMTKLVVDFRNFVKATNKRFLKESRLHLTFLTSTSAVSLVT